MARTRNSAPVQEVKPAVTAQPSLADLPLAKLVEIKSEVERLIGQKQKEKKKELLAQISEMAKAAGFSSVEEIVASQGSGRAPRSDKGIKMPPKYRSKDGKKTWTGKGRKPSWVIEHIAAGGKVESLEIK